MMMIILSTACMVRTGVLSYRCQSGVRSTVLGRRRHASSLTEPPPLRAANDGPSIHHMISERNDEFFLKQIEDSVERTLAKIPTTNCHNILELPPSQRQAVVVAQHLQRRLAGFRRNNDCPRCWLQRAHCICNSCPPLENKSESLLLHKFGIRRIFLVMHHKEVCLVVDTAKLILAAFPETCRLVVHGINEQESLQEMMSTFYAEPEKIFVLFPSEQSKTIAEIMQKTDQHDDRLLPSDRSQGGVDLVVIDGTWEQARRMYRHHFVDGENCPRLIRHVCLSQATLLSLFGNKDSDISDRQLRRHPEQWREISTCSALRLLLQEWNSVLTPAETTDSCCDALAQYQMLANVAAQMQLGPPRKKQES